MTSLFFSVVLRGFEGIEIAKKGGLKKEGVWGFNARGLGVPPSHF